MHYFEIKELDFDKYRPLIKVEVIGGSRPRCVLEYKKGNRKDFLKSYSHNSREIFAEFL